MQGAKIAICFTMFEESISCREDYSRCIRFSSLCLLTHDCKISFFPILNCIAKRFRSSRVSPCLSFLSSALSCLIVVGLLFSIWPQKLYSTCNTGVFMMPANAGHNVLHTVQSQSLANFTHSPRTAGVHVHTLYCTLR